MGGRRDWARVRVLGMGWRGDPGWEWDDGL